MKKELENRLKKKKREFFNNDSFKEWNWKLEVLLMILLCREIYKERI